MTTGQPKNPLMQLDIFPVDATLNGLVGVHEAAKSKGLAVPTSQVALP